MMHAMVLEELNVPLEWREIQQPKPEPGKSIVKLAAAALNKRDYWITKGKYPGLRFPLVLGSDGVGEVDGKEVIINPGLHWGSDQRIFNADFKILGMPDFGTLAELVQVPNESLFPKPSHLSAIEAASLPVCGVTAYRALFYRGRAQSGERMLITGIGGGVASMALLFGVAAGLEVWVSSSSDQKITQAIQYGAVGGANYTRSNWETELSDQVKGKFDLVIDGAGGNDFAKLPAIMNPGGRIVSYGGTRGNVDGFSPQRLFWKQLDVLGSTMGSPGDFADMLDFINQHKIKPIVSQVFPLQDANDAMAVIASSDQFGKICISIDA